MTNKKLLVFLATFSFTVSTWALERPKAIDFSLKIDAARTDQQELQKSFNAAADGTDESVSEKSTQEVVEFFDAEIHWKKPSSAAKR